MEIWRPIPGYPDYSISSLGNVLNIRTGETNRFGRASKIYYSVSLRDALGGSARTRVHHIVAWVFHGPPPFRRAHVRHIDGNPLNNAADNLRWGTAKENGEDRVTHGRSIRGENHYAVEFTDEEVTEMKRRVAVGEKPAAVARAFGTTDRLVYGYIKGNKRSHHQCQYDEAARAMVRRALTPEKKGEIRRLSAEGYSHREIARRIGCSHPAVRNVLNETQGSNVPSNVPSVEGNLTVAAVSPPKLVYPPEDVRRDWRRIPDRDYMIASDGTVWDLRAGTTVPPRVDRLGYPDVVLVDPLGGPARYRVHRLVAFIFLGPAPKECILVRHLDNNPANCCAGNLRWGTGQENASDRMKAGTVPRGERSKMSKLTEARVAEMRQARADNGTTLAVLAASAGVSVAAASMAIAGKTWKHLPTSAAEDRQGELPF